MMITIMVQGCGGSEGDRERERERERRGGSDLIFDHMSVETKVWLASWALRALLHLETPDQVMFFERLVPYLSV